jgi:hypothetical protein
LRLSVISLFERWMVLQGRTAIRAGKSMGLVKDQAKDCARLAVPVLILICPERGARLRALLIIEPKQAR